MRNPHGKYLSDRHGSKPNGRRRAHPKEVIENPQSIEREVTLASCATLSNAMKNRVFPSFPKQAENHHSQKAAYGKE
jgi:hypothetical protein